MLRVVEMRFDHLLDRARRVAKIAIFREVNSTHAAAADTTNHLVAMIEDLARFQRFRFAAALATGAGGSGRVGLFCQFAGTALRSHGCGPIFTQGLWP